jgi:hypothetical protein
VCSSDLLAAPFLVLAWTLRGGFRRAARLVVGFAAGTLVAFFLPVLTFGDVACWSRWFAVLPALAASTYPVTVGNYALATLLLAPTGFDFSLSFLALGSLAFVGAVLWGQRRLGADPVASPALESQPWFEAAVLAIACATGLLGARLVWLHYFVLAIPLLVLVSGADLRAGRSRFRGFWALVPVVAFTPLFEAHTAGGAVTQALVLSAAVLVLAARLFVLLSRGRSG